MRAPGRFGDWDSLNAAAPGVVATMRQYLDQVTCLLRPGSVGNADQALRSLAAFLVENAPDVTEVAAITRRHIEDYIRWLAALPGRGTARITPSTLAQRFGTLRMFFVCIIDWDWPDAPARVPIIPADLPRQGHPLPKALDDATAAKLLRAAQTQRRMLIRVVVEACCAPAPRGRTDRAGRRRGRAHRRRALAARPRRQTPHRPLPAPAPAPGRPHRRLPQRPRRPGQPRCCCPARTAGR